MEQHISVICLIDRTWNIAEKDWDGDLVRGTLIGFSTQSAEDRSGNIIPVGIVILETGKIQSVPVEFITVS
jgi:hypothetical protein